MRKFVLLLVVALQLGFVANAQTVSDFENLNLKDSSYWNGADHSGGFQSGNAFFVNFFDTVAGDFWNGFAASTMNDTVTNSYTNQYSVISGSGHQGSKTFGLTYGSGKIRLTGSASGKQVAGVYVNNGTYAYKDMLLGSMFSKKFGGASGNDSDFFKITFSAWKADGNPADTAIEFYLADFRNPDNSKDYILKDWTWVDLRALKDIDSLEITFASSDIGDWGINTPTYVYLDNFTTLDANTPTTLNEVEKLSALSVYPNPANELLFIQGDAFLKGYEIRDLSGRLLLEGKEQVISVSSLPQGCYILTLKGLELTHSRKFIKN
ncbi:MAG: DUF4465 domain-containing protein [Bacteroidia bacterium]|nr:DUF4465 domain-containing protein [Bacteroidia bacterium]